MSMISEQIKEIRWLKDMIVAHIPSKSLIKNTNDILDRTIDTIETLSAKVHANNMHGGWIPVEERLPDDVVNPITRDSYVYPVTVDLGGITDVRYYSFCRGHWYNQGPKVMDDLVIAWMPLPEPYYKDWKKDMCPNNRTCNDCPLEIQRNV